MSRTIVQEYGPIYGEAVNGTVMGRPNGSVYVPLSNIITLSATTGYIRHFTAAWGTKYFALCSDGGVLNQSIYHYNAVAIAQDLSSYIEMEIYSDSGLTTKVASKTNTAGIFNITHDAVDAIDYDTPQVGDTLYLVAKLKNNSVDVAVSDVIELEVVA